MRLGLSAETYRWVAFPWMRADRPAFRSTSHYAPYLLSVAAPDHEADVPNWLLERVVAHGLTALALDLGLLGSRPGPLTSESVVRKPACACSAARR